MEGGIPGNTMARALRAGALRAARRNKAPGRNCRVVWEGTGEKEKKSGRDLGGKKKRVFGFFRMM